MEKNNDRIDKIESTISELSKKVDFLIENCTAVTNETHVCVEITSIKKLIKENLD